MHVVVVCALGDGGGGLSESDARGGGGRPRLHTQKKPGALLVCLLGGPNAPPIRCSHSASFLAQGADEQAAPAQGRQKRRAVVVERRRRRTER